MSEPALTCENKQGYFQQIYTLHCLLLLLNLTLSVSAYMEIYIFHNSLKKVL